MFLDTSGLMCLFDRKDRRHKTAVEHYKVAESRFTHNYVIAEFIALVVSRRLPMVPALQFVKALADSQEVFFVWVGQPLHDRGLELLLDRSDKTWSLCDSISFSVMSDQKIREALTTDHDFEQAGFVRLLAR